MITNSEEWKGTRARIAYFEDLLAQMRVAARPELFPSMASGYRTEIEKMQGEVLDYLTRHASQPPPAEEIQP
jgi:hypothetical protein